MHNIEKDGISKVSKLRKYGIKPVEYQADQPAQEPTYVPLIIGEGEADGYCSVLRQVLQNVAERFVIYTL